MDQPHKTQKSVGPTAEDRWPGIKNNTKNKGQSVKYWLPGFSFLASGKEHPTS